MRTLPQAIEHDIVRRLYDDAQQMNWQHLSMSERRRQYIAWLELPEVGGVLTKFLTREAARVWIKDCPMKEFSRALAGVGRFREFAAHTGRGAAEMIKLALGDDWTLVDASFGVKPLQCVAENDGATRFICWGPPKDFKHLLWAAILVAEFKKQLAKIVIVERVGQELREEERLKFLRLAKRCSVDFGSVRLS